MPVMIELDDHLVETLNNYRKGHHGGDDFNGVADRLLSVVFHAIDSAADDPDGSPHAGHRYPCEGDVTRAANRLRRLKIEDC